MIDLNTDNMTEQTIPGAVVSEQKVSQRPPKERHLSIQELDRIKEYAKKLKMKPWSDDILWLVDCVEELATEINVIAPRVSVYERIINNLTNNKLRDVQSGAVKIFTDDEERTLESLVKDKRVLAVLRQAVLDFDPEKSGENVDSPAE